jgi:hypothetical protein
MAKKSLSGSKPTSNSSRNPRISYIWLGFHGLLAIIFIGMFVLRSVDNSQVQAQVIAPAPPVNAPMAPPIGRGPGFNTGVDYQNPYAPSVNGQIGPNFNKGLSRALEQLPDQVRPGVSDISRSAITSQDKWERSSSGVYYPKGKGPIPNLSDDLPGAITNNGDSGIPPGNRRPTGGNGNDNSDDNGSNNDKSKWLRKLALWGIGTVCIPAAIGYLTNTDLFINRGPDRSSELGRRDARINADNARLAEYLDTLLKLNGRAGQSPNANEDLATLLQIAENSHRMGMYGDPKQPFTSADGARFILENYPEVWDRLARVSQRGKPSYQTGPTSSSPPDGPNNPVPLSRDLVIFK